MGEGNGQASPEIWIMGRSIGGTGQNRDMSTDASERIGGI
jgi:hypothetical protein